MKKSQDLATCSFHFTFLNMITYFKAVDEFRFVTYAFGQKRDISFYLQKRIEQMCQNTSKILKYISK